MTPSPEVRINEARLSRRGSSQLTLELKFAESVPPKPQVTIGRYGKPILTPGSVSYIITIEPKHLPEGSVMGIDSWSPTRDGLGPWRTDVTTVDGADDSIPPPSVSSDRDTLTIAVDVAGQNEFLGKGNFEADVHIVVGVETSAFLRGDGSQLPIDFYDKQLCAWDTPPQRRGSAQRTPTAPPTTRPLPGAVPAPAIQPGNEPYAIPGITVMTVVKWSGTNCITVRTATGEREVCDSVQEPRSEAIVEHGKKPGDLVGVDPIMGTASWISCEMYLNGSQSMTDYATAGDGTDVTCQNTLS
jgi:hypothetical protein